MKSKAICLCLFGSLVLILGGCASLIRGVRCNREYAQKTGYQDAVNGDLAYSNLQKGQVCTEEYGFAQFRGDYQAGYQLRKAEICTKVHAASLAAEDAGALLLARELDRHFMICIDTKPSLVAAYGKAFRKAYCNRDFLAGVGSRDGAVLRDRTDRIQAIENRCKSSNLVSRYNKSYRNAAKAACTPAKQYMKGKSDAENNIDSTAHISALGNCPAKRQQTAMDSYTSAYHQTKLEIEQRRLVELEHQRQRENEQYRQEQLRLQKKQAREARQFQKEQLRLMNAKEKKKNKKNKKNR